MQSSGNGNDHGIAHRVAKGVVDGFEFVAVDQAQKAAHLVLQGGLDQLFAAAAIVKASHLVFAGHVQQLVLALFLLLDALHAVQHMVQVPVGIIVHGDKAVTAPAGEFAVKHIHNGILPLQALLQRAKVHKFQLILQMIFPAEGVQHRIGVCEEILLGGVTAIQRGYFTNHLLHAIAGLYNMKRVGLHIDIVHGNINFRQRRIPAEPCRAGRFDLRIANFVKRYEHRGDHIQKGGQAQKIAFRGVIHPEKTAYLTVVAERAHHKTVHILRFHERIGVGVLLPDGFSIVQDHAFALIEPIIPPANGLHGNGLQIVHLGAYAVGAPLIGVGGGAGFLVVLKNINAVRPDLSAQKADKLVDLLLGGIIHQRRTQRPVDDKLVFDQCFHHTPLLSC